MSLRKITLILVIFIASSGLVFAQGTTGTATQPIQINFFSAFTGPDGQVVKSIIADFEKENPTVKVNVTTLQFTPLFSKFMIDVKGGNAPDILHVQYQDMASFIELGLFDPSMVARAGMKQSEYTKIAWEHTMYKGKQYAVPINDGWVGLYYNKTAMKKAGISKAPETGTELVDAALKLTIDKNGKNALDPSFDKNNVVQYGLGMPTNHFLFYNWYVLLVQQGETLFDTDGKKMVFNMDKGIKAFTFLKDLVYRHGVVPRGQKAPMDDFRSGKTAMAFEGNWQIPRMISDPVSFEFDYGAFPQVYEKKGAWGYCGNLAFPVTKGSSEEKKNAVAKLAKYIGASDKYAESGHLPPNLKVLAIAKILPYRSKLETITGDLVILPSIKNSLQVYSSTAPSPILTGPQDIIFNNADVASSIKLMKQQIEAELNR